MTVEHGFVPGEKVTGFLRLNTSGGPVMIEITDAIIVGGQSIAEQQEPTKQASERLKEFLETLPEGKEGRNWANYRGDRLQIYGVDSLWGMVPEKLGRKTRFLTSFFNSLGRRGICTKKDLFEASMEDIARARMIGNKGIEFANILREVIREEMNSAQDKNS